MNQVTYLRIYRIVSMAIQFYLQVDSSCRTALE